MITVMGATGHTGKRITERLLQAGQPVRALGRSQSKLSELAGAGAQVLVGESTDAGFLTEAFSGADAVYTLLPYEVQTLDYYAEQQVQGEAIVRALRASAVRHVVALSSVGADLPTGTGPIASHHAQEARLRSVEGANIRVLRAGAFFENFHAALGLIKQMGFNADGVAADVALPMIATRDIADAAAKALIARDWSGWQVRELLGARDLSYREATRIFGERIGKPDLPYVQLPPNELSEALQQAGFSACLAGLYAELAQAISEGRVKSLEGRTRGNTTATRFEDFAEELAAAYQVM